MKLSFLGLFAVGTLLYIEASNSFLVSDMSASQMWPRL
jgi:hypothetical protein